MTTKKTLDSLVDDIYAVFTKKHTLSEDNLDSLGDAVKDAVRTSIESANERRVPTLRMSNIGKPDRQLWYELNQPGSEVTEYGEVDLFEPNPEKYFKFLFGSIIEHLLVFFIKESGHTITHMQEEVEIDGVLGHTDGAIDGVAADIKSASNFQFHNKFRNRAFLRPGNDPFGYVGQISGYKDKLCEEYPDEISSEEAAWLVMNKESGELCLVRADNFDLIDAPARVKHLKRILAEPQPPAQKCYPDTAHGESGNRILSKSCGYCPFKKRCWQSSNGGHGLRAFKYSDGLKFFTNVASTLRVEEVPL